MKHVVLRGGPHDGHNTIIDQGCVRTVRPRSSIQMHAGIETQWLVYSETQPIGFDFPHSAAVFEFDGWFPTQAEAIHGR